LPLRALKGLEGALKGPQGSSVGALRAFKALKDPLREGVLKVEGYLN